MLRRQKLRSNYIMTSFDFNDNKLGNSESSDFHYLLELMVPLYDEPAYAWLPELFSTIGSESLIRLSKYAGGEVIQIPTLKQLKESIDSLDWYYKVYIAKTSHVTEIPPKYHKLVNRIAEIIDARNN